MLEDMNHETPAQQPTKATSVIVLALMIIIPLAVGMVGSLASASAVDGWYADADKAPWTPPNSVFGPVWTVLYVIIGVAAWLVWREHGRPGRRRALTLYVVQLVLNSLWTPLFFNGYTHWGTTGLILAALNILLLLACALGTFAAFRPVQRLAARLLVPYLLWIAYATTLNLYMVFTN